MKILYISSCHPSLEYDDLTMLEGLDLDWFSTGVYSDPSNPYLSLLTRPAINRAINRDLLEEFRKLNPSYIPFENSFVKISKEFVERFDVVWVTHTFPNIYNNWSSFKNRPVIWRTYNQQKPDWEKKAKVYRKQGLKIIRMGETEKNRLTFAGQDAVIRAYVDSNIFSGWRGKDRTILTYCSRFKERSIRAINGCYSAYLDVKKAMPFDNFELYGIGNNSGALSFSKLINKYQDSMVYLCLNNESAVYTNAFMESLMVGIPVVTFGPKTSNVRRNKELANTYEVPQLVEHGVEAIVSDNIEEIKENITHLLSSKAAASRMSAAGRKRAKELFNKEIIAQQWKNFLETV